MSSLNLCDCNLKEIDETNQNVEFLLSLTSKVPRPFFFCQKSLKIGIFIAFIQECIKIIFLESNHKILYFTCFKSCGKNFMKFDHTNWKILAFKVGRKSSFEHCLAILDDFNYHLWKKFILYNLNLKKIIFRSRSKIEQKKTNLLIVLRWN